MNTNDIEKQWCAFEFTQQYLMHLYNIRDCYSHAEFTNAHCKILCELRKQRDFWATQEIDGITMLFVFDYEDVIDFVNHMEFTQSRRFFDMSFDECINTCNMLNMHYANETGCNERTHCDDLCMLFDWDTQIRYLINV